MPGIHTYVKLGPDSSIKWLFGRLYESLSNHSYIFGYPNILRIKSGCPISGSGKGM